MLIIKKRFIICSLVAISMTMLSCGKAVVKEEAPSDTDAIVSMEEAPSLEYDIPVSHPHILVDSLGYGIGNEKQVFFFGNDIPACFTVYDAESNEPVYEGETESRGYFDIYDSNVAVGNFSELKDTGKYYIEADYLGRSYAFPIVEEMYVKEFEEAAQTYYLNRCAMARNTGACHTHSSVLREDMTQSLDVTGGWHQDATGSKDVVSASKTAEYLLLAYELFPEAFSDDTGIPESGNDIPDILDEVRYETDWLFKMQNKDTGAVYSGVTIVNGSADNYVSYLENSSNDASAAFAAIMAKFGYLYQAYDSKYATECLRAADRAWKYISLNSEEEAVDENLMFMASAELYRTSGLKIYENYLKDYLNAEKYEDISDEAVYHGVVTYLNTTQGVDKECCGKLMGILMRQAEDISSDSKKSAFLVPLTKEQDNNDKLVDNMTRMSLVDHIIPNYEYDNIILNYLHYFSGRNPSSENYIHYDNDDNQKGLMQGFDTNAKLIFSLGRIISGDGFTKE